MSAAIDKAKVSGIAGVFGALAALVTGNVQLLLLGGFGLFFLTLLIQYGSFKFKAALSLTSIIGLVVVYIRENGITEFLKIIGLQ